MSEVLAKVAKKVPRNCHATKCSKDGCKVDLNGSPQQSVVVDLDCKSLSIPDDQKRCDYVFVGEEDNTIWISPMELKSGRFSVSSTLAQLGGGVEVADKWLPQGVALRFVPVLAHGKPIHKDDRRRLLSRTLSLRGKTSKTMLLKCGDRLTNALRA